MNSAMKTYNCISFITFRWTCHFHGLCLAAATAALALCPPTFTSQPWEHGGAHSCKGHRAVMTAVEMKGWQLWTPALCHQFYSRKNMLQVSHFLKTVLYTTRRLTMEGNRNLGLKSFLPSSYSPHYQCATQFLLY